MDDETSRLVESAVAAERIRIANFLEQHAAGFAHVLKRVKHGSNDWSYNTAAEHVLSKAASKIRDNWID